jgi:uncharacterized protein (TIGR00369 family)
MHIPEERDVDGVPRIDLVQGQRILAAQPFSVLIGAQLTALFSGTAEIMIPIRPSLLQQHGFVHGGVVSYAADNALTFAGGTIYGDGLTAEYKVNYLRPAVGDMLVARAEVVFPGKRQAVCRCDVYVVDERSEKLCATALGTIVRINTG